MVKSRNVCLIKIVLIFLFYCLRSSFHNCHKRFYRLARYGTKLSPIFGFANRAIANRRSKSSKYKTIFPLSLLPKSVILVVSKRFFRPNFYFQKSFILLNCSSLLPWFSYLYKWSQYIFPPILTNTL